MALCPSAGLPHSSPLPISCYNSHYFVCIMAIWLHLEKGITEVQLNIWEVTQLNATISCIQVINSTEVWSAKSRSKKSCTSLTAVSTATKKSFSQTSFMSTSYIVSCLSSDGFGISILMMFLFTAYSINPVRTFLNEKLLPLPGTQNFLRQENFQSLSRACWGWVTPPTHTHFSWGQLLISYEFISKQKSILIRINLLAMG